MKKELGKWFMDIAKYMVTALLLSSALGNMNRPWVFVGVMIGTILTLGWGLILINKDKKQKEGESYGCSNSIDFCFVISNN